MRSLECQCGVVSMDVHGAVAQHGGSGTSEVEAMSEKAKRHDWSRGKASQHCKRLGCLWRRRKDPREPRNTQYSTDGAAWLVRYYVPPCEGTP